MAPPRGTAGRGWHLATASATTSSNREALRRPDEPKLDPRLHKARGRYPLASQWWPMPRDVSVESGSIPTHGGEEVTRP
jgi:hypothetical protein